MKPSFDEFTGFIRSQTRTPQRKLITPATRFDDDLGVTGDDGVDLLKAVELEYDVSFESDERSFRETFNLKPNEYLFGAEGGPTLLGHFAMTTIFGSAPDTVRPFTVGELYETVLRIQE
jgi:hypothetical protein